MMRVLAVIFTLFGLAAKAQSDSPLEPKTLNELLEIPAHELHRVDIARMNLLCAESLPGSEKINLAGSLGMLDRWASWVKRETDRHLYRLKDPRYSKYYRGSEARLRCELMVEVLQGDFGVRYNPERVLDSDWKDSRDLFLHGLVAEGQGGTCLSMPTLYVAIGRRLGYPMLLVPAKSHIYCRWEGSDECLNMDGSTERGVGFEEDDFYRTWPHVISKEEESDGGYLQPLKPHEELSLFLSARGICLFVNGRLWEGYGWQVTAHERMPHAMFISDKLTTAEMVLRRIQADVARQRMRIQVEDYLLEAARQNREATDRMFRGIMPGIDPRTVVPVQPLHPSPPGSVPPAGSYQDPWYSRPRR